MDKNDLLKFYFELFPDFENIWNSEDNLFRENENFTAHGVCVEFSHFFQENHADFSKDQLKILFEEIEKISIKDDEIKNAIYTCFLEIVATTESSKFAKSFMGTIAKDFIGQFE